jgi:glucokinase
MLLAGDVGGTKTSLGIYSPDGGPREPIVESTLPSARYASLVELVSEFLSQVSIEIERASFGVAGPVLGGRARITNLPWVIEEAQVRDSLHLESVQLFNDLEAIACGVTLLEGEDLHTLNEGVPVPRGTLAVIAPGTGLGEAFLIWCAERYRAYPSEGGHADFGPNSDLEIGLLRHLRKKFGHVSLERICSGHGLPNVYTFLKESGYAEEQEWVAEQLSSSDDPTPVIVNAALDDERRCALCNTTLEIFISALGAEAGNLALKVMATGGVYLGGGIPPRIISLLDDGSFMERFTNKGRFSELVSRIPVHVIINPKTALMGAALHGLEISRDRA